MNRSAACARAAQRKPLALGSGLGLTSVSPWAATERTVTTFGALAAIWLVVVQRLSSAFGGYVAGRLRTKWVGVHSDEVIFRDTAHGVLAWALATVVTVALVVSAGSSLVSTGAHVAASVAQGAAQGNNAVNGPSSYFVDMLFRPAPAAAGQQSTGQVGSAQSAPGQTGQFHAESARILAEGLARGDIPESDRAYLIQLVTAQTGISTADARKRVDDVIAQAKSAQLKLQQSLDSARKAASGFAFFTAFSLLIGAFVAGVAGALGGRKTLTEK